MSRGLKLNVKNVLLGYHNFSDTLGRNDYRFLSGFTSLAGPRSTPFSRPDYECYKQDIIKTSPVNLSETVFPRKIDDIVLKRVFSEIPVTGKWLEESRSLPIVTPGAKRLPWNTAFDFYYERKKPQCPPPIQKPHSDCKEEPLKPPPPPTITPTCPANPRCYPCKLPKADPCEKRCRLYSTSTGHLVTPKWVAITARSLCSGCDKCEPKKSDQKTNCPPIPPPPECPKCDPTPETCEPQKCGGHTETCPEKSKPKKKCPGCD
ncbi:hypothetical protein PYW08_005855 [Mythimna loreyi]|uniref:Uncharacterized protein n=1 Tax=Mythimna loreyi TaxID=667449 RepID=A0ACC2QJT6_9NEOP|nr:hypothetical protein PYW08_005855 [Mythimna loreyi]